MKYLPSLPFSLGQRKYFNLFFTEITQSIVHLNTTKIPFISRVARFLHLPMRPKSRYS